MGNSDKLTWTDSDSMELQLAMHFDCERRKARDGQESQEVNKWAWKLSQDAASHVHKSFDVDVGGIVRIFAKSLSILLREDKD